MKREKRYHAVQLADAAEDDFWAILRWTEQRFGSQQAIIYKEILLAALDALHEGPAAVGVRNLSQVLPGLFTLHVARKGRKARHFIMFLAGNREKGSVVDVIRILHDSMDIVQHLPEA